MNATIVWLMVVVGTGSEAYWKAKGGSEFKILGVPYPCDVEEIVSMVRAQIEQNNDAVIEEIVGYNVEQDDYLSEFEQSQLEYDGEVRYPEPTLDYGDLVAQYAD